jgi:hypothetical protein
VDTPDHSALPEKRKRRILEKKENFNVYFICARSLPPDFFQNFIDDTKSEDIKSGTPCLDGFHIAYPDELTKSGDQPAKKVCIHLPNGLVPTLPIPLVRSASKCGADAYRSVSVFSH